MAKILQLKIRLEEINPEIWRRFLVEDNITFHQLHNIIQNVMGWENYHAYDFYIKNKKIIFQGEGEYSFCVDATWRQMREIKKDIRQKSADNALLSEFLTKENEEFVYIYDLGDCWAHVIKVEKIIELANEIKYPLCIAGEMTCPPEDCGGIHGYEHLLEVRKNKKNIPKENKY